MCKDVLNDFEKRLLQRANTSAFDFFLTAIIILNCIEKSTWLFKSWDQESFKGRWPLDKKPEYFALQGDRLANTINMLLNVRSSPPKTFIRPDGILATDGDSATVNYFNQVKLECKSSEHLSCFKPLTIWQTMKSSIRASTMTSILAIAVASNWNSALDSYFPLRSNRSPFTLPFLQLLFHKWQMAFMACSTIVAFSDPAEFLLHIICFVVSCA